LLIAWLGAIAVALLAWVFPQSAPTENTAVMLETGKILNYNYNQTAYFKRQTFHESA